MAAVDFQEVRQLYDGGYTQQQIAKKFGVSRSYISDIVCYRTGWHPDDDVDAIIQGLKDDRSYARRRLKQSLRAENLLSEAAKLASQVKPLRPAPVPKFPKRREAIQESAVLVLSDGHHDQVVTPEQVGGLENYNFNVSLRRAEVLCDSVVELTQRTLVGYDFDRLVVFYIGDHTSGEIHDADQHSAFRNQFKNTIGIGALHGCLLRDLAAYFPRIDVKAVPGNHGRRTPGKQYAGGPHNNWDYAVAKYAQAYCSAQDNIFWEIPDSFSMVADVQGFGFHLSHGDEIAGNQGNPWNGLRKRHERQSGIHRGRNQDKSFRRGHEIDAYVIGHHHTRGIVSGNGVWYICNGAWLCTDPFAYEKLGVAGPAEQVFFGVNKKRGITWQFPIQLEGRDNAKKCRYDSVLGLIE